jgi:hypothetical protein
VGQEPKDRAAATVRYLSHREAWAYAANLADDVHAHRQPGSFNPKLQVLVSFLAFFWPARPVANGERVTVRVHPPLPLPSLLSRQGLFQSSGKPDDASRAAAIACATRAMRCQGFVGLDEQQCVQMRAMQLLFPGARLRPSALRTRGVRRGARRMARRPAQGPSRSGIKPSRDSESFPYAVISCKIACENVAQKEISPHRNKVDRPPSNNALARVRARCGAARQ